MQYKKLTEYSGNRNILKMIFLFCFSFIVVVTILFIAIPVTIWKSDLQNSSGSIQNAIAQTGSVKLSSNVVVMMPSEHLNPLFDMF